MADRPVYDPEFYDLFRDVAKIMSPHIISGMLTLEDVPDDPLEMREYTIEELKRRGYDQHGKPLPKPEDPEFVEEETPVNEPEPDQSPDEQTADPEVQPDPEPETTETNEEEPVTSEGGEVTKEDTQPAP